MLRYFVLCFAILRSGLLHMLCYFVPCCAMFCYFVRCRAMLCLVPLCYVIFHYAVVCCAMLYYVMKFFARLSYAVLCCALLCYELFFRFTKQLKPFDLFRLLTCKAVSFGSIGEKTNKYLPTRPLFLFDRENLSLP